MAYLHSSRAFYWSTPGHIKRHRSLQNWETRNRKYLGGILVNSSHSPTYCTNTKKRHNLVHCNVCNYCCLYHKESLHTCIALNLRILFETDLAPAPEADRHAGHRKPMDEVRGAIHRVNYPRWGVREICDGSSIGTRFLRHRKNDGFRLVSIGPSQTGGQVGMLPVLLPACSSYRELKHPRKIPLYWL